MTVTKQSMPAVLYEQIAMFILCVYASEIQSSIPIRVYSIIWGQYCYSYYYWSQM